MGRENNYISSVFPLVLLGNTNKQINRFIPTITYTLLITLLITAPVESVHCIQLQ